LQFTCTRSFFARGCAVELHTCDPHLAVPDWIRRRDAAEMLPIDRVWRYQHGFCRGSPSPHSNLFRYEMLRRLGGWWVDMDIVMLREDLPAEDFYFAQLIDGDAVLNVAALKAPAGRPILADAVARCRELGETPHRGQVGPYRWTGLVAKHGLGRYRRPCDAVHAVSARDIPALFDPARRQDVETAIRQADFFHLFNEVWRGSGVPRGCWRLTAPLRWLAGLAARR